MIEQRCRRAAFGAILTLTFTAAFGVGTIVGAGTVAVSVAPQNTVDSVDDPPDDTLPDDTLPDDTLPEDTLPDDTLPDDTLPEDSEPDDTDPDDTLVGAGDPDGDIDPAYMTIAVIGFVALVLLASWWMVRRDDPDAGPMPPDRGDRAQSGELI